MGRVTAFQDERAMPQVGRLGRGVDWFARQVSPRWAARRQSWRMAASEIERFYRAGNRSRLDPTRSASGDLVGQTRDVVIERARDLERDSQIADGLLTRCVENVNGPDGFALRPRTGSKTFNGAVENLWHEYADHEADVRGMDSLAGLLGRVYRSHLRDGDCGAILRKSGALQVVEADLIDTPLDKLADRRVIEGVQVNRDGRPVGYYVEDTDEPASTKYTRVPARDFAYLVRRPRNALTRGVPVFSKPWLFEQLENYMEALVVNQRVAACFGLVITEEGSGGAPGGLRTVKNSQGDDQAALTVEPGMVKYLRPGQKIEQVVPRQPTPMFEEFVATVGRFIGLPLGLPLELAFLDFSRTNYSSARASLLQAYRSFRCMQVHLARLYSRVYRWRVSKWMKEGRLERRDDAWLHNWQVPGWAWIDPMREVEAHCMAIDAGLQTRGDVVRGTGRDVEDVDKERAAEETSRRAAGLPRFHSTKLKPLPDGADDEGQDTPPDDDGEDTEE